MKNVIECRRRIISVIITDYPSLKHKPCRTEISAAFLSISLFFYKSLRDDSGSDSAVNCTYVFTLLMSRNDLCGGHSGDICVKVLCRFGIVHLFRGISVWCSELGRYKVLTHKPVVLHKQNVIVL